MFRVFWGVGGFLEGVGAFDVVRIEALGVLGL